MLKFDVERSVIGIAMPRPEKLWKFSLSSNFGALWLHLIWDWVLWRHGLMASGFVLLEEHFGVSGQRVLMSIDREPRTVA